MKTKIQKIDEEIKTGVPAGLKFDSSVRMTRIGVLVKGGTDSQSAATWFWLAN